MTTFFETKSFDSVAMLSEQELLDHFDVLVVRDRRTTAELLVAIAEIDERKLWAGQACSSMFTFCMERFHMSEQVTAKRLWAARMARRFPVILEMVERGELHLAAIHLLSKHLTEENHVRVLELAKHKSSRAVERLAAELAPRADVQSRIRAMPRSRAAGPHIDGPAVSRDETPGGRDQPDSDAVGTSGRQDLAGNTSGRQLARPAATLTKPIVPLSPRRYKIEITVDEATHDKLRSLQDLLGRSATGRDPAAIISRAIDVLLVQALARKAGCTDRRKPMAPTRANSTEGTKPTTSTKVKYTDRPASSTLAADTAASQRAKRTRTIPAAVRREVWQRDCGRCCYADARGRRCRETSNVEFHHKTPFAIGGQPTLENIELRCAAHNQYQADLDFGRSFMDGRRGRSTFPGECWGTSAVP
jgi:hypothetical protein